MNDFSSPKRMSPGSFVIYFFKYFRLIFNTLIFFMALELFGSGPIAERLLKISGMIGVSVGVGLILAALAYFKIRFYVEGGNFVYRNKLFGVSSTTIPLSRIHALRTKQGLIYRLFNLRGILVDTLALQGEEVEIILSEADWRSLLYRIESEEEYMASDRGSSFGGVVEKEGFKRFSNKNLMVDALCQNHLRGMLVLGGFAAFIFDHISDISRDMLDSIEGYVESYFSTLSVSIAGVIMIMVSAYIVSLVLWLVKVLLRYYDLTLTYDNKILNFSHGMFSHSSSRFSRDKVSSIWVKRNYFEKRLGLATLCMRQAVNASAKKEEDNLKIYGKDSSGFFLSWWLGEDYAKEDTIIMAKSGKGVFARALLQDLLISAIATFVLLYSGQYIWVVLPAIYFMVGLPKAILKMRHSHIVLRDDYLVVGSGCYAEIRSYIRYENIEAVRLERTPVTVYSGKVSLMLSTTGQSFKIRSLREESAQDVIELILAKSAAR